MWLQIIRGLFQNRNNPSGTVSTCATRYPVWEPGRNPCNIIRYARHVVDNIIEPFLAPWIKQAADLSNTLDSAILRVLQRKVHSRCTYISGVERTRAEPQFHKRQSRYATSAAQVKGFTRILDQFLRGFN